MRYYYNFDYNKYYVILKKEWTKNQKIVHILKAYYKRFMKTYSVNIDTICLSTCDMLDDILYYTDLFSEDDILYIIENLSIYEIVKNEV